MYSKNKGITDRDYVITPPPGYDGSRFRRRSDGRDDAFLSYSDIPQRVQKQKYRPEYEAEETCPVEEEDCPLEYSEEPCRGEGPPDEAHCEDERREKSPGILSFLESIGGEELLLIALILLLSKDNAAGIETILILALLLCIV